MAIAVIIHQYYTSIDYGADPKSVIGINEESCVIIELKRLMNLIVTNPLYKSERESAVNFDFNSECNNST
jgi:hypothetical protein